MAAKYRKIIATRLRALAARLSPETVVGRVEIYTSPQTYSNGAGSVGPVTITQRSGAVGR